VLFLTCWCRKRLSQIPTAKDTDSFPLPISSAFTPSIPHAQGNALSPNLRSYRPPRSNHNRSNARSGQRKSKLNLKAAAKGDSSNTIPIRGFEAPKAPRLASSAPSTYSPLHPTASPASALAKMTAGGFKPRQTPARAIKNAASKGTIEAESTGEERGESVTPRQGHLGDLMASGEPRRETMGTKRVKV